MNYLTPRFPELNHSTSNRGTFAYLGNGNIHHDGRLKHFCLEAEHPNPIVKLLHWKQQSVYCRGAFHLCLLDFTYEVLFRNV